MAGLTRSRAGVTLTELMVATAILTIGILGFFGSFRYITQSIHVSRVRTLATNLAQEKIETLKNLTYYELLITTPTYGVDATLSPSVVYDQNNYPPETITIGGVSFTRYTFVAMAQIDSDVISTVTWTFPDTGMKQITTTIIWQDSSGAKKSWSLTNLLENPDVNPLDASLSGYVNKSGATALSGAVVKVEQNPDWNALTDSSGYYSFRVFHGSYTVRASSASYWDGVSALQSVSQGSNVTVATITLTQIGTGTIAGEAWYNPNLVIANVVAASSTYVGTAGGGMTSQSVEYWALFNPTTYTLSITGVGGNPVYYTMNTYGRQSSEDFNSTTLGLTYVSTAVASNQSYLIANTSFFLMSGTWHKADAYYSSAINAIHASGCGSIVVTDASGSTVDQLGWDGSSGLCNGGGRPLYYNGAFLPLASNPGIGSGNQLVRVSSPAASTADLLTYGKAYNSKNNTNDFIYPTIAGYTGIWAAPRSTNDGQQTVITGIPAVGALVAASDPYSGSTTAFASTISSGALSLQVARFSLVGVSTTPAAGSCSGSCWTLFVTSSGYYGAISTVSVTQYATTSIPNAATIPAWTASGLYHVGMTTDSVGGFVKGNITDIYANPIPGITLQITGVSPNKSTASNGDYFGATATSGTITIIVNPNNANTSYVQQIQDVTVNTGQITTQNFILTQGGSITGYVTSGTTPLPNYVVTAYLGDGSQAAQSASNSSGVFTLRNLSTGTYTIAPTVETGQDSNPNSSVTTLTSPGTTVFSATFTVSGAYGYIVGTVKNNNASVTTGALLVASTATISSPPPDIIASSAPAYSKVLYAESSKADGTYSLPVRGNATYYLSAFIPSISNSGVVTTSTKTYSTIYVTPSNSTTQDITLP